MDVVKEYETIVHRMTRTARLRTAERIRADFDVPLFKQMVENGAFQGNSMLGLVNTTFDWIKRLHCPKRDEEADAAKAIIMTCTTMEEVIPKYIGQVTKCLDYMDEDMAEFMKYKDHPVMQEAVRRQLEKL